MRKKDEEEQKLLCLRMHEEIDKRTDQQVEVMRRDSKYNEADVIMLGRVQRAYLHAIIDMRAEDGVTGNNFENSIVALMANEITMFIYGTLPVELGGGAIRVADRMIQRLEDIVFHALCTTYHNTGAGPRDGDKIN